MSAEQKFKCEICGKSYKAITNSHLKSHNVTTKEYKEMYPDSIMGNFDRFNDWRHSEANMLNCKKMTEMVYNTPEIREKRKKSCQAATKKESYRNKMSKLGKEVAKRPERQEFFKKAKERVTDWMKLSNYERWVIKYGKKEADQRQLEWSNKNKLPSNSTNTKPEIMFIEILNSLAIEFVQQKSVKKYKCDFYIPEYNVIVEIDGDYWHANPEKYQPEDLIGGKKLLAKDIWEKDRIKSKAIIDEGYVLKRYWASELKNISHDKVFEDIVHTSMKVEE